MKKLVCIVFLLFSAIGFAQNNYIVTTEDGRRVLLKADYTWEYIDLVPKTTQEETTITTEVKENTKATTEETTTEVQANTIATAEENTAEIKEPEAKPSACGLSPFFVEPPLNKKVQASLKKNRATMPQLKKKVAKQFDCDVEQVLLLQIEETTAKGRYTFCANGEKVVYKRIGASFFKKQIF